jgi:tRNA A-37 threonylcarbamoyl transferase component Bud32
LFKKNSSLTQVTGVILSVAFFFEIEFRAMKRYIFLIASKEHDSATKANQASKVFSEQGWLKNCPCLFRKMQEGQKFITGRWKGLVRDGWEEAFSDIPRLADSGEVIVDKQERMVRRIETPKGVIYYKYICGAGTGRGWYFLKNLLRTPRSLAVWRISEQMRLAGVGCPLPLLAVSSCRFSSFSFEDILVTAEVPFPQVSDLLRNADSDDLRSQILQKAGQGIRELHEKGFVHGDCLPGNICMAPEGRLFFLDNDRTRRKSLFCSRKGQLWNLVQFCSHALTVLPNQQLLQHFLRGYEQTTLSSGSVSEREKDLVLRMLQRRVSHLEREFGKTLLGSKLSSTG